MQNQSSSTGRSVQKNNRGPVGVSVFVQARMGSTRLPGKVLLDLEGKTVLEHIVNRLRKSRLVQKIVVVTSTDSRDHVLVEVAGKLGVDVFAGSEHDVLNRYAEAARHFPTEHVVRITADCPLVDPLLLDKIVKTHLDMKNQYTSFVFDEYPRGVGAEVFKSEDLFAVEKEAKKPYEREHVTPFFYQHPEKFKLYFLPAESSLKRPDLRLTLDTQDDFNLIKAIFQSLYKEGKLFSTPDVIQFLGQHPHLTNLNRHVKQKSLTQ